MNKLLFKSIMVLNGDRIAELAKDMNLSEQTIYNKMNEAKIGKNKEYTAEFTQGEIAFIVKRYNMTEKQLFDVFFAEKVS